ncbi:MAG: hypothetical protein SGILL_001126 [Bacillariaceae sp.]
MEIPRNESNEDSAANALVEVTSLFQDAVASALTLESPMMHTKEFSLQDSMAALEVMHKKMDIDISEQTMKIGKMVPPTSESECDEKERMLCPRPPPTGLDDEVNPLPWNELTVEDSAFIAMENMIRLESLLSGSSVVEATYTSLYTHKLVLEDMRKRLLPEEPSISLADQMKASLQSPSRKGTAPQYVVFASTLMLVELTDLVRGIVLNADIYEEEDFAVSTFNIPTFQRPEDGFTLKIGHAVLEMIEQESSSMEQHDNQEILKATSLMLGFQLDFIAAASSLARLSGKNIRTEVEQAQQLVRLSKKKLERFLALYPKMKEKQSESIKTTTRRAFDAFVNRPLVGNAPVRMIDFMDATESIPVLIRVIHELDWGLCKVMLKANSLGRIRRMIRPVSAASANILVRSLLVLNLYFDDMIFGQYPLPNLVVGNIQQLSHLPDNILQLPAAHAFLNRLCKPVYDTLKLLTLNRNRQRSYLDAMLGDWSSLREEAYIADMTNHQESGSQLELHPHFSHYVLSTTIELMDLYVDLGVILELFSSEHDLTVAYWYRDFLTSSLLTQLNTMRRYKLDAKQAQNQEPTVPSASKKSGNRKNKKAMKNGSNKMANNNRTIREKAPSSEDVEEEVEYLLWNAKRSLCRGLVRFFPALKQAGLVVDVSFEFTSKEKIFLKRFESFIGIHQPPLLTYKDFELGTDATKLSQKHLVASSKESFSASKSMLEKALTLMEKLDPDYLPMSVEEMKQLSKVCLGNSIYLQRLVQVSTGDGASAATISVDTKTNKCFCIVKLS